jgi:putative DNA primase/helicase
MSQSPQPQTYNGDFADPPKALTRLCLMPNWVLWKWQLNEKGDWTKPPYKASNPKQHAKSNNPETWSDRHAAVDAVLAGKANGTGFVLTGTDVAGIDLDKCRNPVTGQITDWAAAIINAVPDAYVEVTVSGTGLRIIGIAAEPEVHRAFNLDDGGRIELFRHTTRYITISGLQLGNSSERTSIS